MTACSFLLEIILRKGVVYLKVCIPTLESYSILFSWNFTWIFMPKLWQSPWLRHGSLAWGHFGYFIILFEHCSILSWSHFAQHESKIIFNNNIWIVLGYVFPFHEKLNTFLWYFVQNLFLLLWSFLNKKFLYMFHLAWNILGYLLSILEFIP